MNKILKIWLTGMTVVVVMVVGMMPASVRAQSPRLNIIYIMSDDHAYQAISAYGYGLNQTPNIDQLANEGMRFNKAFVTNSICGPSRAVMLTGKYSHINGFKDNATTFDSTQITVPRLMHDAGYQTAIVGKWHLVSNPVGFDYWNILPGQGDYNNPVFIENGVRKNIWGMLRILPPTLPSIGSTSGIPPNHFPDLSTKSTSS